jgi:hypothetical protein
MTVSLIHTERHLTVFGRTVPYSRNLAGMAGANGSHAVQDDPAWVSGMGTPVLGCCDSEVPYPRFGAPSQCPQCGSVFAVAGEDKFTGRATPHTPDDPGHWRWDSDSDDAYAGTGDYDHSYI